MRVYDKSEVDTTFSDWQSDLDQLSVVDAVPMSVINDIKAEILDRMWNCRGKWTTSIDKVKMETIIKEIIDSHISGKEK